MFNKKRRGQVILLSVMVLGGIMISATVIAGLLTRFQISQVNDAVSSARALFVGDSAVEFAAWQFFKQGDPVDPDCNIVPSDCSGIEFDDITARCNLFCNYTPPPDETLNITAEGFAGRTSRVIETNFRTNSTTTSN